MDFDMGDEVRDLRTELRQLIKDNVPADFLGAFTDDPADLEVAQRFCHLLSEQDLLCMAWPPEWGGRGASPWEQTAVREEMWAHHEPRGAQYMGVNWVGPAIMRHGTPAQQQQHLPAISRGEVIWCQGFSEPNSGSDLASLQTAAPTRWRWLACQRSEDLDLVRNDGAMVLSPGPHVQRPEEAAGTDDFSRADVLPGIEVRPIACMIGPHHLNEVFFDNVWVTEADVLGTVDEGWRVVQEVLAFERVGIARYARCERLLLWAPAALGDQWEGLPDALRGRWARMLTHTRRARLLAYKVVDTQRRGQVRPGDAAPYRIAVTRLDQESADVLMDIVGLAELADENGLRFKRAVQDHWKYSQASTVASGSIEMQRILLARSLVGSR